MFQKHGLRYDIFFSAKEELDVQFGDGGVEHLSVRGRWKGHLDGMNWIAIPGSTQGNLNATLSPCRNTELITSLIEQKIHSKKG